jgi:hypothetical protein
MPRRTAGPMVTLAKAGRMIGMKTFGASAPLKELHGKFGFEPGRVVEAAKSSWAPLQRIPDFVKANITESETYLEENR